MCQALSTAVAANYAAVGALTEGVFPPSQGGIQSPVALVRNGVIAAVRLRRAIAEHRRRSSMGAGIDARGLGGRDGDEGLIPGHWTEVQGQRGDREEAEEEVQRLETVIAQQAKGARELRLGVEPRAVSVQTCGEAKQETSCVSLQMVRESICVGERHRGT